MVKKQVVIYSYSSPEEITGIGKYNGEMIDYLISNNMKVNSFSNAPFYPFWKKYEGYSNAFYSSCDKGKLFDVRSAVYIPESPGPIKKILSEISFFLTSSIALIINIKRIKKSSLFIVVNPPFFLGVLPLFLGKLTKTPILFHIQDLQIDAAKELNLLPVGLCKLLENFEKVILKAADVITTISHGMKYKIIRKGISKEVLILPNWSSLDQIVPGDSKWLHDYINVNHSKKLVVYSGNIGEKQGLEIVLNSARQLEKETDIFFVILGAGLYINTLKEKASELKLKNLIISDLVPNNKLSNMLQSSFIQLVVQKSAGADSFLPSKLTNILAAGCASIITAAKGTSLYSLMAENHSAMLIKPDDSKQLSKAIIHLVNDPIEHKQMKLRARQWAEDHLAIEKCLSPLLNIIN